MRFIHRIISVIGLFILFYIRFSHRNTIPVDLHDTLTEKYTVPSVNEILWNEKYDEKKVVRFNMEFKNLKINYFFNNFGLKSKQCSGIELLIIIFSRPNAFHGRMALRNSWLRTSNQFVTHRFIIGSTWDDKVRELIEKEAKQYGDLIVTNIRDTYLNGTLKAFALLQWQQHYCSNAKYLLKTDDDAVVIIQRLQYWIKKDFILISKNNNDKAIFCKVLKNGIPLRNPNKKWYLSKQVYNKSTFPHYCSGATYLMTTKAVNALINETPNHNFIHIEDVFFPGIIAKAAGVKLIDKWKHFGYGNTINSKFGCDERGVPLLTTIYESGNDDVIYDKNIRNKFDISTAKLLSLSCKWWHTLRIFE